MIVVNLAHGADGRWRALDGRGIGAHRWAAGAVYDAVLRHNVAERTGLRWTRRPSGALELGVVGTDVIGALSGRRAEILQRAGAHASPNARRVAWAATRAPKGGRAPDAASLRATWASRAGDAGTCTSAIADALDRGEARRAHAGPHAMGDVDERVFAASIGGTFHGGVTRRQVVAAWAAAIGQGDDARAIDGCVEEIGPWGEEVGVAERQCAPRRVVPSPRVLGALGPRPCAPARLRTWLEAAAAIERYHARWPMGEPWRPPGAPHDAGRMARMPPAQLAGYLAVSREVDGALARLGRGRHAARRAEIGLDPGRAPGSPASRDARAVTGRDGWLGL